LALERLKEIGILKTAERVVVVFLNYMTAEAEMEGEEID